MATLEKNKEYYLGLDIGTDSVGYAVTDKSYNLCKYLGEPMWGSTLFDEAMQCEERRNYRTSRRRLDRRQQRVELLQEIFALEISKIDKNFFIRLKESALYPEDRTNGDTNNIYFNDKNYSDSDYYNDYPTIHHLIWALMNNEQKQNDPRLVYLACAWLVSHRGHFLSEVSKDKVDEVVKIDKLYENFEEYFIENDLEIPWHCNLDDFSKILSKKMTVTAKEKAFKEIIDVKDEENYKISKKLMVKLLSGGKVKAKDLFNDEAYADIESFSLGMNEDDFYAKMGEIGDDSEIIIRLKALYDWSILTDILQGCSYISEAKIKVYEQHKEDLKSLKYFIKEYVPAKYDEVFRDETSKLNYVAYTNHCNKGQVIEAKSKTSKEDFCKYMKGILKDVKVKKQDENEYNRIMNSLDNLTFMPKQVESDNRVIPYQLYWIELKLILDNAKKYLPFLNEKDANGFTPYYKIMKIFEFKIPYFVGPLRKDNSNFAWIVKNENKNGKIYPWNFEEIVDLEGSEREFIRKLINNCTYLPGEKVLPKYSLLYCKFTVLNEINNIKVNGNKISTEMKQKIYEQLFTIKNKISLKNIKTFLISQNYIKQDDIVDGADINLNSTLKPYLDFKRLMENGFLSSDDVEKIIEKITYTDERSRVKKWLEDKYSNLSKEDINYISKLKYNDFGRLSKKFLNELEGVNKNTGEKGTILHFMWNYNYNLNQLLSDDFTFVDEINLLNADYYGNRSRNLNERLEEMYIPNGVKRSIYRTLDIVNDVVKVQKHAPSKIFIEMARGGKPEEKGKRTKSRKQQIEELYAKVKNEDISNLRKELEDLGVNADNKLQSEALFLYFTQLGKCMYTGKPIALERITEKLYDRDHIYPQCFVKDDSTLNNKVLVLTEENGHKSNKYPIEPSIQSKMAGFWRYLKEIGAITDEKYKRLTRTTPFSDDEKWGFINRQLVETRQSTKAVATILKEKYPNTEIVYTKANLASDFRHEYDIAKSRSVNDLHHAKDAYLNVVVGNVYNSKFTKQWFFKGQGKDEDYSIKVKTVFKYPVNVKGECIWKGQEDIGRIKKIVAGNRIHLTKYATMQKGGFFDQMPLKKGENLVPRKKGLDPKKYGGYNKTSATYFVLVKYETKSKKDIMLMPVELLFKKEFESDSTFAENYARNIISNGKDEITKLEFLFNKRPIKINTIFSLDGLNVSLSGKTGKQVIIRNATSLNLSQEQEKYIKRIDNFMNKRKDKPNLVIDSKYDGITLEGNLKIYDFYMEKLGQHPFNKLPNSQLEVLKKGREKFAKLGLEMQAETLSNIISILKTNRAGAVSLKNIGGVDKAAVLILSMNLSNWFKIYKDVRIVDMSSSGLYKKESCNLVDLL